MASRSCCCSTAQEPNSAEAEELRRELADKYSVTCLAVSCMDLGQKEIEEILKFALYEFPIAELGIFLPPWLDALPEDAPLRSELYSGIAAAVSGMERVRDAFGIMDELGREGRRQRGGHKAGGDGQWQSDGRAGYAAQPVLQDHQRAVRL